MNAEYVKDINVKTSSDENTCYIRGSTFLSDKHLVIADNTNNSIKVVDVKQGIIINQTKFSSSPLGVCTIKKDQVAVTLPSEKKIALVKVDGSILVDKTISVDGACCGVDSKDDKLAVTFITKPYKVQVLSLQGEVLHSISTNQHGQALFDNPSRLILNKDEPSLYVVNRASVVCVTVDGTLLATFKDNELKGPTGATMDSNGNVYVCGANSHTVLQISPNFEKLQVLLSQTDGITNPYTISYSESGGTFCVGMFNNNNVKVYKVCD